MAGFEVTRREPTAGGPRAPAFVREAAVGLEDPIHPWRVSLTESYLGGPDLWLSLSEERRPHAAMRRSISREQARALGEALLDFARDGDLSALEARSADRDPDATAEA